MNTYGNYKRIIDEVDDKEPEEELDPEMVDDAGEGMIDNEDGSVGFNVDELPFANKINILVVLLRENGYFDIKSLIKEGYGYINVGNKVRPKVVNQIERLASELNIKVKYEEDGDSVIFKIINQITLDTFKQVLSYINKEKKQEEMMDEPV